MIRFTLTLAIVLTAVFSYGQRAKQITDFSEKVRAYSIEELKNGENITPRSTNMNIAYEEHFNTFGSGPNGLPAGWTYPNTILSDTLAQFRFLEAYGSPAPSFGMRWFSGNNNNDKDETVISPEILITDDAPYLWIDIALYTTWFIDGNTDDVWISVSNDDFVGNETLIYYDEDSMMIKAAGLTYPPPHSDFETGKFDMSAYAGQTIKIKFHTEGIDPNDQGNSVEFDNIMSVDFPEYDVEMRAGLVHFWDGGIYAILPQQQTRPIGSFYCVAENVGQSDVTGCVFHNTIDNGSTPILELDSNFFTSGEQDLAIGAVDTFTLDAVNELFDLYTLEAGEYKFSQQVLINEEDGNTTNNKWSFNHTITNSTETNVLQREIRDEANISLNLYPTAVSGDELGTHFMLYADEHIDSIGVMIANTTDAGTEVQAFIYEAEVTSTNTQPTGTSIENSEPYVIEASDIGNMVYLKFLNGGADLTAGSGTRYIASVKLFWGGELTIGLKGYGAYQNSNMPFYSNNIYSESEWKYTGTTPVMPICFTPLTVLSTSSAVIEENIVVYPNPTNGILHINNIEAGSTIKVYNMLGAEVANINNANAFNTVNLSSYNEGTYLVKIYNDSNVVVKKVNLVK